MAPRHTPVVEVVVVVVVVVSVATMIIAIMFIIIYLNERYCQCTKSCYPTANQFWAKHCIYLKNGVGCVPCTFHFNWWSHIIRLIDHPSLLSDPNSLSIASSIDPSDSFQSPCFAWPLADIRRQAGVGKVPHCGLKRMAQILIFSATEIEVKSCEFRN